MKASVPVTIDDLECTALDDKNGIADYRFVKVHWNGWDKQFSYFYKGRPCSKLMAEAILKVQK